MLYDKGFFVIELYVLLPVRGGSPIFNSWAEWLVVIFKKISKIFCSVFLRNTYCIIFANEWSPFREILTWIDLFLDILFVNDFQPMPKPGSIFNSPFYSNTIKATTLFIDFFSFYFILRYHKLISIRKKLSHSIGSFHKHASNKKSVILR